MSDFDDTRIAPMIGLAVVLFIGFAFLLPLTQIINAAVPTGIGGGSSSATYTTTADFDGSTKSATTIGTGAWSFIADMPQPVTDMGAASYGGFAYSVGGLQNGSSDEKSYFFRYNPVADVWASLTAVPTARWGIATAVWADRIYAFTGDADGVAQTVNEYYNVTSATWTTPATLVPVSVRGQGTCAVTAGSFIYIILNANLERYNPATDAYTPLTGPTSSGNWQTCAVIGDFLYMIGGASSGNPCAIRRYTISAGTWNNAFDTVTSVTCNNRFSFTRYNPVIGGIIYLANGLGTVAEWFRDGFSYNPETMTETLIAPSNMEKDGVMDAVINGILYMWGGRSAASGVGILDAERFDPTGTTTDQYDVETITDNARVALANQIELASLSGDTFSKTDHDADTWKWDRWSETPLVGIQSNERHIGSGALRHVLDCVLVSTCIEGVSSVATVSGDFDIRIEMDIDGDTPDTQQWEWMLMNEPQRCDTGTVDGVLYMRSESNLLTFQCLNGGLAQQGGTTAAPGDPLCLRVTRAGTTYTTFYSTACDGSYTMDDSFTNAGVSGAMHTIFGQTIFTGGSMGVNWDDWQVVTGTIVAPGLRTTGSWTTPTTILEGQVMTITLGHSSLSATAFIDRVDILVGGVIVFTDDTNIIAGTQTVLTPNQDVDGATSIRVTLARSGTATPVVEDVAFSYEEETQSTLSTLAWIAPLSIVFGLLMLIAVWVLEAFGGAAE
jgi:hypothetical protein